MQKSNNFLKTVFAFNNSDGLTESDKCWGCKYRCYNAWKIKQKYLYQPLHLQVNSSSYSTIIFFGIGSGATVLTAQYWENIKSIENNGNCYKKFLFYKLSFFFYFNFLFSEAMQ